MFNQVLEKYVDELKEGEVYLFSKGNIKLSNKKYTSVKHEFCITFDKGAIIEPTNDHTGKIAYNAMNFIDLKAVS